MGSGGWAHTRRNKSTGGFELASQPTYPRKNPDQRSYHRSLSHMPPRGVCIDLCWHTDVWCRIKSVEGQCNSSGETSTLPSPPEYKKSMLPDEYGRLYVFSSHADINWFRISGNLCLGNLPRVVMGKMSITRLRSQPSISSNTEQGFAGG